MESPTKDFDCVVCGSCVVDLLVRPVELDKPLGGGRLFTTDPIQVVTGGIVSNSGIAMARLGMRVAAFSQVGCDDWAPVIRSRYAAEGLNASSLITHPTAATSTTAVLVDPSGERTFAHCVGAPKLMTKADYLNHLELFARSRYMLLGYYSLLPNLERDLAEVLQALREVGCATALDAAGEGGTMNPLEKCLPHLDVYCPSHAEARHQTGHDDPEKILNTYRHAGATGLLGVKLGADGAVISPSAGVIHHLAATPPPGPIVDTTGAGDSFYAGLITGLIKGLNAEDAGRLAAATGACSVAGAGASEGIRDYNQTFRLAGL